MKIILGILLASITTFACPDGNWSVNPKDPRQFSKTNMTFELNVPYSYCVKIPQVTNPHPFIEWKVVNKGNSSCSNLKMVVIDPNGKKYKSFGSQPGLAMLSMPGLYKVKFKLKSGCKVYDASVNF